MFLIYFLNIGCDFKPIYQQSKFTNILCEIKVANTKDESKEYEEIFKNKMQSSLCLNPSKQPKYVLAWDIIRSKIELIGTEANRTVRYELNLKITFSLIETSNGKTVFSDTINSGSEYNILEDEIISTLASEKSAEEMIVKNLNNVIIDKIYMFAQSHEN